MLAINSKNRFTKGMSATTLHNTVQRTLETGSILSLKDSPGLIAPEDLAIYETLFRNISIKGHNKIRLPIYWAHIQSEGCEYYNELWLANVRKLCKFAGNYHIDVHLAFHPLILDLVDNSDKPAWVLSSLASENFANVFFIRDTSLQKSFIDAARHLYRRLKDCKNIVSFELLPSSLGNKTKIPDTAIHAFTLNFINSLKASNENLSFISLVN